MTVVRLHSRGNIVDHLLFPVEYMILFAFSHSLTWGSMISFRHCLSQGVGIELFGTHHRYDHPGAGSHARFSR